uniref:Uncharacterized protein n=1 Tax=Anguilla anguilla TaxID=7936 RepID=A0A0E9TWN4_ANGAN
MWCMVHRAARFQSTYKSCRVAGDCSPGRGTSCAVISSLLFPLSAFPI